jgi:pimeloyl-ACP methyl ester carboxylesterase
VAGDVDSVVEAHRAAGTAFTARGVQSFVRAEGDGEPVVLLHGLPASSFLYRKVLPELAARGLRGVAFDLPGLGLAGRPTGFDYSIAGLGVFCQAAVDELGLGRFHLVVHDAGGPIGFEMAGRIPGRIMSLTILNTVAELTDRPFPGEVLARVTGHLGGPLAAPAVWRRMMYRVGILDRTAVPPEEVDAYRVLALGDDDGAGYLAIMRRVRDDPRDYRHVVRPADGAYPVQVVWGVHDPILKLRTHGLRMLASTGLPALHALPGRHYLQEDRAPEIAELVARHARVVSG